MSLVVFDMGRRIETSIRPKPERVEESSALASTRAIKGSESSTQARQAVLAYQQQEQAHKQPDLVALISDILHREVQCLNPDQSLSSAWELFKQTGYHHFPVINNQRQVLAILSDGDLLRALVEQPPARLAEFWHTPVIQLAKRPVLCVHEHTDIRQSSNLLYEYNIGSLPVLNNRNELCGIVTRSDILRLLSHYGPMELWA